MPELPEVETVRRGIEPRITGATIKKVVMRRKDLRYPLPPNLPRAVTGWKVSGVRRRGKYLLVDLARAQKTQTMIVHLGMTGMLFFESRPPKKKPEAHEHLGFLFDNDVYMLYRDPRRFGCVLLADDADNHPLIRGIGAEPLSSQFNGKFLREKWRGKKIPVKTALMDGNIVCGVGNIYASESLFLAGIRPQTRASHLDEKQCAALAKAVKDILRRALKAGGSTIRDFANENGEAGHFQMQWNVYGRGGMPCRRCGGFVVGIQQNNRTSYYCPRCQPALI